MPAKRLPMRKTREVLRLSWGLGLTSRQVAASLGLARSTVAEYIRRAEEAGLSWPLPPDCDDFILERRLFPPPSLIATADRPLPDWSEVARELTRKHMTLFLIWHEYKAAHPVGYQYSRFCDLYREWAGRRSVWMRQDHKAGERIFVDYAGGAVPIVDRETDEARQAQVFVAVLGASNYIYAEATWTQGLEDWVGAHIQADIEKLGRYNAKYREEGSAIIDLLKDFKQTYDEADEEGKAIILSAVIDRATLRNGDLFIAWKRPFDALSILGEGVPRKQEWRV